MNEPLQTVLACPVCASLDIYVDDTLDSYTGSDNSIICCSVAHCQVCGRNFNFEEVYKFAGYRDIELDEN